MSSGAERKNFATTLEWVDAALDYSSEYSKKRDNLLRQGYMRFFDTVFKVPGLDLQPSKHWSDYDENEITFVTHDLYKHQSLDEEMLRIRMSETLGFWSPKRARIGVFNVEEGADKFVHGQSASVIVESTHMEIFRPRMVLHLHYRYSEASPDWYDKGIRYDLFGIKDDQLNAIESADELDLLLAVNAAAELYSREISREGLQTTS